MILFSRVYAAIRVAGIHFILSVVVGLAVAALVFGLWYPYPYSEFSGGRELFSLVVIVDVVCGPLLTFILYNPQKPSAELRRDLALVAMLQLAALGYGCWAFSEARPLFLVQEVDRFKVISAPDLRETSVAELPASLQPKWWIGPRAVAIRAPKDDKERNDVLFESVQGGRDYAERPEFYLPYSGDAALKSLNRAKPLAVFLQKHPSQQNAANKLAQNKSVELEKLLYLPVLARQDWVAVIDSKGIILGFLKGDGF